MEDEDDDDSSDDDDDDVKLVLTGPGNRVDLRSAPAPGPAPLCCALLISSLGNHSSINRMSLGLVNGHTRPLVKPHPLLHPHSPPLPRVSYPSPPPLLLSGSLAR